MAFEAERKYLAEEQAQLVQYRDNELLIRRELVRIWPRQLDNLVESSLSYLYDYASADNLSPQQWITTPKAQGLEYPGVWRVARNEKTSQDNEAQWPGLSGIIQTLREGFAKTLNWDEARVVNNRQHPGNTSDISGISSTVSDSPEDYLLVEFVNLDPAYMRRMIEGIDTTVDDPQLSRIYMYDTYYQGTWHVVAATTLESELDDGSGRVQLLLARPQYTLNAYGRYLSILGAIKTEETHYLWNVPKDIAQTILDDYKAHGRSATASYSGDNLVNLVLGDTVYSAPITFSTVTGAQCSFIESTTYYWGVPDPTAAAYDITGHPKYQEPGWTLSKRVDLDETEGVFTVIITARQVVKREYAFANTLNSRLGVEDTYEQFGLTDSADILDISRISLGLMYRQDIRIQPDCSRDVSTRALTSEPRSFSNTSSGSVFRIGNALIYRNWTTSITAPAGFEGLGIYRVTQVSINQDGSFDGTLLYEESSSQLTAAAKSQSSILTVGNTLMYRNWPDPISVPDPDHGLYRVNQTLNELGTYDAQLIYDDLQPKTAEFVSLATVFKTGNTLLYRNWPTPISAPSPDVGIYRVSQTLVEGGVYNGELVYVQGNVEGILPFRSTTAVLIHADSIVYKDYPTPITIPNTVDFHLYRVSQTMNDEGLYNGELIYRRGQEFESIETSRQAALLDATETREYNKKEVTALAAEARGQIRDRSVTTSDEGLYDIVTTLTESNEYAAYIKWPLNEGIAFQYIYQSWRDHADLQTLQDTLNDERINSVSTSLNLDGSYDALITSQPKSSGFAITTTGFYYESFKPMVATAEDDVSSIRWYLESGSVHHVTYHSDEEDAFSEAEKGFNGTVSRISNTRWRVDKIVTIKENDPNRKASDGMQITDYPALGSFPGLVAV